MTDGHDAVLDVFFQFGVQIEMQCKVGNTVVHEALFSNKFERALRLLERFKKRHWSNKRGQTIEHLVRRFLDRTNLGSKEGRAREAILRRMLTLIEGKGGKQEPENH